MKSSICYPDIPAIRLENGLLCAIMTSDGSSLETQGQVIGVPQSEPSSTISVMKVYKNGITATRKLLSLD